MRVPDEASTGKAKVTLSFPDWKEGNVAPAQFEVPIIEPEAEGNPIPKAEVKAAVDLTKIDRTIAKEPAYQSEAVKYCLLVFGPEAKTRVWLVVDGDVLYVDRNGNGDLTEKGECCVATGSEPRIWEAGDIIEVDGKSKHTSLTVRQGPDGMMVRIWADGQRWQRAGGRWMIVRDHWPDVFAKGPGRLEFALQAQEAPIIHLNGPVTVNLLWPHALKRGEEADFIAVVGTFGLGPGAFAHFSNQQEIPGSARLEAAVAFPNRDVAGKPILVKFAIAPDT